MQSGARLFKQKLAVGSSTRLAAITYLGPRYCYYVHAAIHTVRAMVGNGRLPTYLGRLAGRSSSGTETMDSLKP